MNRIVKRIFYFLLVFALAAGLVPAMPAYAAGQQTIELHMNNYSNVSLEALKEVAEQSRRDGVNVILYLAQVVDKAVVVQIKLDPKLSTQDISLTPSIDSPGAVNRAASFKKYYSNRLFVIATGQEKSYGQSVELAVKPDFTGWDTTDLCFYSYDAESNTYKPIEKPKYWIDSKGYLQFTTELAGDIVVSEGKLQKK